ncbi:cyclin-K-like [Embiotoca jacksoni]|uniref:cyclin-K-like n=1 Tax=Embiotoca jacksoni TaxID=100190 RepID=UPI003703C26B
MDVLRSLSYCDRRDPASLDHIKPCWYWDKQDLAHTPSQAEGMDPATEARYRREGARFIFDVGTRLGLHYGTLATGIVYFHRFYMFHSFKQFSRYVTAGCCLFLAGKVEETPKKCKDIIKTARSLLNDVQFAQFGDDPKEEVMVLERILLQTIKFDLQVDHPYQFLLRYAKQLKGDKNKVQKLVQMAWTFVNDSLCTLVALQWEPQIIAVSVMYLAGRLCKFDIQDWTRQSTRRWWEQFVHDVPVEVLEDICHQILDLYSQAKQQLSDHGFGIGDIPPPPSILFPAAPPACQEGLPSEQPPTSQAGSAVSQRRQQGQQAAKSRSSSASSTAAPPLPRSPSTQHHCWLLIDLTPYFFSPTDHSAPPSCPPAPDLPSTPAAPPLPHCPPPLPPPTLDVSTSSSLMSCDGYQQLQSMMTTEGSCYTALPPACAPPLGYHHYPPGTMSYHTPPLSAYSYLLAAPPPSVMGMAPSLNSGYAPPSTSGHSQLPPLLPPGMPPISGINQATWMR